MESPRDWRGLSNAEESNESVYQNTIKSLLEEILESNPSAAESALAAATDTALRVPCYCEENVWRLAFRKLYQQIHAPTTTTTERLSPRYFVVFVSNPKACVPMFHQRASSSRTNPVFWDYHVFLISTSTASSNDDDAPSQQPTSLVWDMDSHLPCPYSLNDYLEAAFGDGRGNKNTATWPSYFAPYFRVVDAETFCDVFRPIGLI